MIDAEAPEALKARFEALESRLAYQEHWLDTLDQAVAAQERRLAQLERLGGLLQSRLREQHQALMEMEGMSSTTLEPRDETPPHY
jgi:SlyX protein